MPCPYGITEDFDATFVQTWSCHVAKNPKRPFLTKEF